MTLDTSFLRFALVGLASNALIYLLYLLLTQLSIQPKLAMSLLFTLGMAQTFYFNRAWTFSHAGKTSSSLIRYATVYFVGYLLNLFILIFFVDYWGWPHQWVQAVAILAVAVFLFFSQKLWVFTPDTRRSRI